MSVNPSGEMQFWYNGLPFSGVKNPALDGGEIQFWIDGQPYSFIFPPSTEYSWESSSSLPTDDATLANVYSVGDYTNVSELDSVYTYAHGINTYLIHLYKDPTTGLESAYGRTWSGSTTNASTIYLQIYNFNSNLWETIDSSSDFPNATVEGSVTTNLTNYLDSSSRTVWRVYLEVV